ncbi:738_t:CDS:1, partial [Scutellospora calospora]
MGSVSTNASRHLPCNCWKNNYNAYKEDTVYTVYGEYMKDTG